MPRRSKAQKKECNRRNGKYISKTSEEEQPKEEQTINPKKRKTTETSTISPKKQKDLIYVVQKDLQHNILQQNKILRDLKQYNVILNGQIKTFSPFSAFQINPTNLFVKNPKLVTPINYYYLLDNNQHLISGYGGKDTFPTKHAMSWTGLEQRLFIDPLTEYVKKIKTNLVAFSMQKIFYNDEIGNYEMNKKRMRKRTLIYPERMKVPTLNKSKVNSNLTSHLDPPKYLVISGTTVDASNDGECILTLTDNNKFITDRKLNIYDTYILSGKAVYPYKHKVDVKGKRLAIVVRFVDMDDLEKENYIHYDL